MTNWLMHLHPAHAKLIAMFMFDYNLKVNAPSLVLIPNFTRILWNVSKDSMPK